MGRLPSRPCAHALTPPTRVPAAALAWIAVLAALASVATVAKAADSTLVVRDIEVLGNQTTKEYVITREMLLKPGMPLTQELVDHDRQRIYNLRLFNRVDIEVVPEENNEATVFVVVHERLFFYPFPVLGFKYRDIRNFYYGLGLTHQNLGGRNEKLYFSFALGFDQWVKLEYQDPRLTPDDLFWGAGAGAARYQNLSPQLGFYYQRGYNAHVSFGKRFGLYRTAEIRFDYEILQVPSEITGGTISPAGRDAFPSVSLQVGHDSRDLSEYATRGYLVKAFFSKSGFSGKGVDFFRYGIDVSGLLPVFDGAALGARAFTSLAGGPAIPPYKYVYFGYGERIRGHFSTVLEGENIAGATAECRIPILSPRYYVFPYAIIPELGVWRYGVFFSLFADVGKTWFNHEGFSGRPWSAGTGASVDLLLPYSIIIRAAYAVGDGGTSEFILDFGTSF
jgi:outer membrane protein assembly factor BamA